MSEMKHKTRGTSSPQGKPRVYFTCHPDDFEKYFEPVSDEILSLQNCAIYYYEPGMEVSDEEKETDLSQMQLFVIPVTVKLLSGKNSFIDVELLYAMEHNIPVLPLLQERGIEKAFNIKFGNLQFLSKFEQDPTAIRYEDKLSVYLSGVLFSDELAEKIRGAFDAYIFLSYRKKDRKYAQELMRLIHKNDFCRDIAIWYDEFLVPGENFDEAIESAMKRSKLFAMVVTPNLVNEENYVMTTEYPMAKEYNMPVLPAEVIETDKTELKSKFSEIPDCMDVSDESGFSAALRGTIKSIALERKESSPEHDFFIGLAYLSGIDVEVNHDKALEIITSAANTGLVVAIEQLVNMYMNGIGVKKDMREVIKWQTELAWVLKEKYSETKAPEDADNWFKAETELSDCYRNIHDYATALKVAEELYNENKDYQITDGLAAYELAEHIACLYRDMHNYDKAAELLAQVVRSVPAQEGDKAADYCFFLIRCYTELGIVYWEARVYDEAERMYLAAIDFIKTGSSHGFELPLANTYEKLGILYSDLHRYKDAERYLLDAIEIYIKYAPEFSDNLAELLSSCYNHLGLLYSKLEQDDKSLEYLLKALEINKKEQEENPGVPHINLARSYGNLGVRYIEMGIFDRAEEMFFKEIDIYKKLCRIAPEVYELYLATAYGSLGGAYHDAMRLEDAETVYLKSIDILERRNKDNPETFEAQLAYAYANLSGVYLRMGRNEEAKSLTERSIEVLERLHQENSEAHSEQLVHYYLNAAEICKVMELFDEVDGYCIKAKIIIEGIKEKTPDIERKLAKVYGHMSSFFKDKQQYEAAEEMALKGIDIYEKFRNAGDNISESQRYLQYMHLADIYRSMDRLETMKEILFKALEIIKSLYSKNPAVNELQLAECYRNIGGVNILMNNFFEAEHVYLKCIKIYERHSNYKEHLIDCYVGLSKVYRYMRQEKKAKNMYLRARRLKDSK